MSLTPISRHLPIFTALLVGLGALEGCSLATVSPPQETTKYRVENTEQFIAVDEATADAVNCTGLQQARRSDGRLEVVANVKNRLDREIAVQLQCGFRNGIGFPLHDETLWQTATLPGFATQAVHFVSADGRAEKFSIRIRFAPVQAAAP
jgi:hypothetical protein